jgi:hypothetical protein
LSAEQADAIAGAASVDPAAEAALLESARHDGVRGLRVECERVKAAACDDESARDARVREARSFRHWVDADGAGRIDARGPVDAVARVIAGLEPHERRLFDEARRSGRRERPDALAFDALVAATAESGTGGVDSTVAVAVAVRVDRSALDRGYTEPGELCEIPGLGPIPVHVASRLLDDAFVKALLVDSTDVLAVSHLGRTIPAKLRTAVEELYPECVREGCHVTQHLEIRPQPTAREGRPDRVVEPGAPLSPRPRLQASPPPAPRRRGHPPSFVKPDDPEWLDRLNRRPC